jgi:tetratricopeptide (TPR) repeat protein
VHYLFDRRAADLLDYERALARGDDAQKSWKGLFPDLTGSDMDDVVRKYIHKRDYQIVKAIVPPVAVSPEVRSLSEADVLAFRAALYMAFQSVSNRTADETKKLATESVAASLGVDEGSFWAHLVNMFYFDSVTATPDIGRRATVDHANNWLAWLFYADVQRRAKAPLDEQRSALAKALELAPKNRTALTQLSFVEARAGKWKAALAAANQAVASPPVANDSVLALVVALSHSGHCSEARSVEEVLQKRLPKEVPKDFAATLAECREACASEPADTAKR